MAWILKSTSERLEEAGATKGTSTAIRRCYVWQKGSGGVSNPYSSHHEVHDPSGDAHVTIDAWFKDGIMVAREDPNNGRLILTQAGEKLLAQT